MILVVIVAVIIVAALATILIRWVFAQPKMSPLPGYPGVTYHAYQHEVDVDHLQAAFRYALIALSRHSKGFPPQPMLADVRIFVMPENEWTDDWGRRVAGLQNDVNIVVGRDFAALAHELAHRVEVLMYGSPPGEPDHAHWAERGYNAAIEDYHAWLRGAS